MAGCAHGLQVVEHSGERHAHQVCHLGRGQRRFFEEQAVDGVLVGLQPCPRKALREHAANSLRRDEQVEEQRDVGAPSHTRTVANCHGSVIDTTGPCYCSRVRRGVTAVLAAACLLSCAPGGSSGTSPSPTIAPAAQLAATITEHLGGGPHPGIVIVHGAEPGQRYFYDLWVGVYASIGLAVLTYDKRGNGASTGRYPGEFPTEAALAIYADDAAAALGFLAPRPGRDPNGGGVLGGS